MADKGTCRGAKGLVEAEGKEKGEEGKNWPDKGKWARGREKGGQAAIMGLGPCVGLHHHANAHAHQHSGFTERSHQQTSIRFRAVGYLGGGGT